MEHLLGRAARTLLAATTGAFLFAGCAGGAAPLVPADNVRQPSTWAEELKDVAATSKNPDERTALADGKISDEEYEAFTTKIVACFAKLDLDASFDEYGTLTYNNPQHVPGSKTDQCNTDNGIRVVILRNAIIRNPDRINEDELMTNCLRASNVVPESYTASDLRNGVDFDRIYATDEFGECTLRPLEIIDALP